MKRATISLAILAALCASALAADQKGTCDVKFKVVKAETGRPVRNASVVLHPVNEKGKQESGGLQLKTDSDGETAYNGVPYGKLRVQVLARGLQTFGQDYDIGEAEKTIEIKMQPPQQQYSIYDDKHPEKPPEKK